MAHDLGYTVGAEGVETARARDVLADAGCDEFQGYFISRPIEADAFDGWLRDHDRTEPAASKRDCASAKLLASSTLFLATCLSR